MEEGTVVLLCHSNLRLSVMIPLPSSFGGGSRRSSIDIGQYHASNLTAVS